MRHSDFSLQPKQLDPMKNARITDLLTMHINKLRDRSLVKPALRNFLLILAFQTILFFGCSKLQAQSEQMVRTGKIESAEIHESSGLVLASEGGLWTINDSGNKPELFLISQEGKLQGTVELSNAKNVDWESLASVEIGGTRKIVVADVGDNFTKRKKVTLYFVDEPSQKVLSQQPDKKLKRTAEKIEFKYEGGPINCEAVFVDVQENAILLIEKLYLEVQRKTPPGVYRLDLPKLPCKTVLVAKRIGDFPIRNVTGADINSAGDELIIRNYFNAHYLKRSEKQSWAEVFQSGERQSIACPLQRQGEAVCFTQNAEWFLLTSEKKKQPIWKVLIPQKIPGKSKEKQLKGQRKPLKKGK